MKHHALNLRAVSLAALCTLGLGGIAEPLPAHAWNADNGDGTYSNPPLYADYPDPDIIRVGEDFYFVSTTFVNSPGLVLLHSKDLVNWELVTRIIPRLDGKEQYDMKNGVGYRAGVFAPSIRHHKGTFYVVVTPVGQSTRIYSTQDVRGPWKCTDLKTGAFDPGFFIDTDGTGYIFTSGGWDGTVTLLKLNADFTQVVEESKVHYYKGIEGSKAVKRGDWYYLFNAIPGKLGLACSRAKDIKGPYETMEQIDDRTGGHQGAIVDLPDGNWYGFVMKDSGSIGRMTNISPIFWKDDWPVWGTPEAPGKVPDKAAKPILGKPQVQPATSDEFDAPQLGTQWYWNHNPDDSRWSLKDRPGYLRLRATKANEFWLAQNTLTQKGQGPWSRGEVRMDVGNLKPGDICGFGTLGKYNGHIAVTCSADGKLSLGMNLIEDNAEDGRKIEARVPAQPLVFASALKEIWLRTDLNFKTDKGLCSYSTDGKEWTILGGEFPIAYDWRTGTFQGTQFAIFCYSAQPGDGYVDVASFRFADKP